MRGDAKPGQRERKVLAQWQIAERMSVFEQISAILAGEYVEALADAGFVEPRIRQPWAAGKHGFVVRVEQLADQPDELLVALVVIGRRGVRRDRAGRCVEAGAAA